jgi:hypothetical protein
MQRNPDTPKFSHSAVDAIVSKMVADAEYIVRARESYAAHRKKLQRKRT